MPTMATRVSSLIAAASPEQGRKANVTSSVPSARVVNGTTTSSMG